MSMKHEYDVIVIGGGPAGMMAAGRAGERGLRVLLLEKNPELGKKLSITGGGRCNITNAELDIHTFLKHYKESAQFLYSPFSQFGVSDTFDFFTSNGLPLVTQERKRAFPKTEKATDVTHVMVEYVRRAGVTVCTNTPVLRLKIENGSVSGVVTNNGIYTARAYILASGGKSHPETGSTGEGISWLNEIGHAVHSPNPDIVPIVVKDEWVRRLSGTTLTGAQLTCKNKFEKIKVTGNILCTHFGISGPTVLNSARKIKEMLSHGKVEAEIDLFPTEDIGTLRKRMQVHFELHANKTLKNALAELVSIHIAEAILEAIPHESHEKKTHGITRDDRHALINRMKCLPITIIGTKGFEWAVVSDGGVDLSEIDTKTMQSKLHSNIYLVGDVLNVHRQSGGFSLQLCWTTGWVAGNSVC